MADETSAKPDVQNAGGLGSTGAGAHDWQADDAAVISADKPAPINLKASFNATGVAFSMAEPTLPYDQAMEDQRAIDDARERDRQELFLNLQDTDEDSTVRGGRIRRIGGERAKAMDIAKKKDGAFDDIYMQQVLQQISADLDRIDELLAQAEEHRRQAEKYRKEKEELDRLLKRLERGEVSREEMDGIARRYLSHEQLSAFEYNQGSLDQAVTEKIREHRNEVAQNEQQELRLAQEKLSDAELLFLRTEETTSRLGPSEQTRIIMSELRERENRISADLKATYQISRPPSEEPLQNPVANIDLSQITTYKLHGTDETNLIAGRLFMTTSREVRETSDSSLLNSFEGAVSGPARQLEDYKNEPADDTSANPAFTLKNNVIP